MTCHTEILKIYLEEKPLIKYYKINLLRLLKTQYMTDNNMDLIHDLFFVKKSADMGCRLSRYAIDK